MANIHYENARHNTAKRQCYCIHQHVDTRAYMMDDTFPFLDFKNELIVLQLLVSQNNAFQMVWAAQAKERLMALVWGGCDCKSNWSDDQWQVELDPAKNKRKPELSQRYQINLFSLSRTLAHATSQQTLTYTP